MIMEKLKVGCSPITSKIYAGKVLKNGMWGVNKADVTDSAVAAVAQYLLQTDQNLKFEYNGKTFKLNVAECN